MISRIRGKVFYGWWVLLACAGIQFYLGGTFYQGFTALFNPIASEFHWSYAVVSFAFTFRGFEAGVLAPVVGFVVDKFGPRKLLLIGVCITCVGFLLFSRIQNLAGFYGAFLLLAFGLSFTSGVVSMAAVSAWFSSHKRSTLAMGILASGFGAAGLLVPAVVWLVDWVDWRNATVIFAIVGAILCLPLALLVKDPPGTVRSVSRQHKTSGESHAESGSQVREILKHRQFWILSSAVLFAGVAGMAVTVHQIPHMVNVGVPRQEAGMMVVVFSLSSIAGRLCFGWFGDIYDKRRCFVVSVLLSAAGVLAFALSHSVWQFIPAMAVLGFGMGGVIPLRPALQVESFGTKNFGAVQGLLIAAITAGGILSPPLAGWVFDISGSYQPAFVALAAVTLLAVPAVLMVAKKGGRGTLPEMVEPVTGSRTVPDSAVR